jgi:hypothetical protein
MVAVTYGLARVPAAPKAGRVDKIAPRKSWFVRFFNAVAEARLAQAEREIRMHINWLPHALDERSHRLIKTDSGDMPFGA